MKKKPLLFLAVLAVAFLWLRSPGGDVPLEDGSFLVYQEGGFTVRLTFHLADGGKYRTVTELVDEDGTEEVAEHMEGHDELVDKRMRTSSRGVFELGMFGPLWVPPGQLKEGGSAYGARVSEVRGWNGRDVAVVSASVGMGAAFRGEWYYDLVTGFLVGGMKSTAVSQPGQGQTFTLTDTNITGLVLP